MGSRLLLPWSPWCLAFFWFKKLSMELLYTPAFRQQGTAFITVTIACRSNKLEPEYQARASEGLSKMLAFLREEGERERLLELEKLIPVGQQVSQPALLPVPFHSLLLCPQSIDRPCRDGSRDGLLRSSRPAVFDELFCPGRCRSAPAGDQNIALHLESGGKRGHWREPANGQHSPAEEYGGMLSVTFAV